MSLLSEARCGICQEEYSASDEKKKPRVFICGHTICTLCALSIHKIGTRNIHCPFDRIAHPLKGGWLSMLKKNFALMEIIEKRGGKPFCEDCAGKLCEGCSKAYSKMMGEPETAEQPRMPPTVDTPATTQDPQAPLTVDEMLGLHPADVQARSRRPTIIDSYLRGRNASEEDTMLEELRRLHVRPAQEEFNDDAELRQLHDEMAMMLDEGWAEPRHPIIGVMVNESSDDDQDAIAERINNFNAYMVDEDYDHWMNDGNGGIVIDFNLDPYVYQPWANPGEELGGGGRRGRGGRRVAGRGGARGGFYGGGPFGGVENRSDGGWGTSARGGRGRGGGGEGRGGRRGGGRGGGGGGGWGAPQFDNESMSAVRQDLERGIRSGDLDFGADFGAGGWGRVESNDRGGRGGRGRGTANRRARGTQQQHRDDLRPAPRPEDYEWNIDAVVDEPAEQSDWFGRYEWGNSGEPERERDYTPRSDRWEGGVWESRDRRGGRGGRLEGGRGRGSGQGQRSGEDDSSSTRGNTSRQGHVHWEEPNRDRNGSPRNDDRPWSSGRNEQARGPRRYDDRREDSDGRRVNSARADDRRQSGRPSGNVHFGSLWSNPDRDHAEDTRSNSGRSNYGRTNADRRLYYTPEEEDNFRANQWDGGEGDNRSHDDQSGRRNWGRNWDQWSTREENGSERSGERPDNEWRSGPGYCISGIGAPSEASAALLGMGEFGCNVCQEEYSALVPKRVPRVLSECGHTICTSCVASIHRQGSNVVLCPFDRIPTPLTEDRTSSLKKNFALLEVIEKIAKRAREDNGDPYSSERLLGVECDEDATHIAVIFCTVCESNFCERCAEASHSTNVLSKHRRVRLSERPRPSAHCPHHTSYALEFVCVEEGCEGATSRLMCLLCRDYGHHKDHRHAFLDKEAETLRETIDNAMDDLRRSERDITAWMKSVQSTIACLSDRSCGPLSAARDDVRTHFRLLREKMDRDESGALSKLEGYMEDRLDDLANHQRRLVSQSAKISSTCGELGRSGRLEAAALVDKKEHILSMVESARAEKVTPPGDSSLSTLLPFHIGTDNRLHIGHFLDARVVLLGLDGAGKTTLVARLKRADAALTHYPPTIGFNVDTVHHRNFRLNIWDVGGLPKLRPCWKHYFLHTQALVFVLDGAAEERFPEALAEYLSVSSMVDCPLVVVINGRRDEDNSSSASLDALIASLRHGQRAVEVLRVDAARGGGIKELLDHLTTVLAANG